MTKAGYARDANNKWAKDGAVLDVPVYIPSFFEPVSPTVHQNLLDAGFDSTLEVDPGGAWVDKFNPGNHDTLILVHCGSLSEPYDTLKDLHSKNSAPIGTNLPGSIIAGSRYTNPAMDAILDQLEAMTPDNAQDSKYMDLVAQAVEIYLQDVPELMLTEELHVVTFNNTYWTGWPSAADPYVAPYPCWEAFNMVMYKLQPTGAA